MSGAERTLMAWSLDGSQHDDVKHRDGKRPDVQHRDVQHRDDRDGQQRRALALRLTVWRDRALLALTGLVAFLMTANATYKGAGSFFSEPAVVLGVTALALSFLVTTSFTLSEWRASGGRWPTFVVALAAYALVVVFCWVCSYAYYVDDSGTVMGADSTELETVMDRYGRTVAPLEGLAGGLREARLESLREAGLADYATALRALDARLGAADSREAIDALRAEAEIANRRAQADLARIESESAAAQANLERLAQAIPDAEQRLSALEPAMALEAGTGGGPAVGQPMPAGGIAATLVDAPACSQPRRVGRGGPGTCFAALQSASDATRAALGEARAERDRAQAAIEELTRARAAAESRARQAGAQLASVSGSEAGSDQTLAALASRLEDAPAVEAFEAAASACQTTGNVLATLPGGAAGAVDCRPRALASGFAALGASETALDAMRQTCGPTLAEARERIVRDMRASLRDAAPEARGDRLADSFDRLGTEGIRPCLEAARAAGLDTEGVEESVTRFVTLNTPRLDRYSRAVAKIAGLATGRAGPRDYLMAMLALLQETALLVVKLFWDATGRRRLQPQGEDAIDWDGLDLTIAPLDAPHVLAAKMLLTRARAGRTGLVAGPDIDRDMTPATADRLRGILNRLQSRGLARPSWRGGGVTITRDGVRELERIVAGGNARTRAPTLEWPELPALAGTPADIAGWLTPFQESLEPPADEGAETRAAGGERRLFVLPGKAPPRAGGAGQEG